MRYASYFCCAFSLISAIAQAQVGKQESDAIAFMDLEAFEDVTGNWQLAQDVFFDSLTTSHEVRAGRGIIVNQPSEGLDGNLFTRMQHGDIELEFEFLMAKQSNSGVYFQGRYEVQLFDSWGVKEPAFYDCGGIYQRWDETRPGNAKGFEGKAPGQNACGPPGEWQHFRIVFQAPEFGEKGDKIANARFLEVIHNGIVIHRDVEVTGPTRSSAFEDEQPFGPLMLQGDHGPVAFRNIRYTAHVCR